MDNIEMKTRCTFSNDYQPYLSLHLYAEVDTEAKASILAQAFITQLKICSPVILRSFSPYWKIPEYYDFEFDFMPNCIHDMAFDCLVGLCSQGWSFIGMLPERTAVWNPYEEATFLTEQVRWASIELFYINKPAILYKTAAT